MLELQTNNFAVSRLRAFLFLASILSASGCTAWRIQERSLQAVFPEKHPPAVRIELQDGSRIVVTSPDLDGSDLVGFGKPGGERVRLGLSQIKNLWIRELDKKRTTILVGGLAVAGTIAFIFREKLNLGLGYNAIFQVSPLETLP